MMSAKKTKKQKLAIIFNWVGFFQGEEFFWQIFIQLWLGFQKGRFLVIDSMRVNSSKFNSSFEVLNELTNAETAVIVIIWFSIQFFGNGLLIGLIQFDRFGEDPLKRRINDQVSIEAT